MRYVDDSWHSGINRDSNSRPDSAICPGSGLAVERLIAIVARAARADLYQALFARRLRIQVTASFENSCFCTISFASDQKVTGDPNA